MTGLRCVLKCAMAEPLKPRLDILPSPQRALWLELPMIDGNLNEVSDPVRRRLVEAVRTVDLDALPRLARLREARPA
jgi:hypothetical protein